MKALRHGSHNLVGYVGDKTFPLKHGNCFSLHCDDGGAGRFVDRFVYENFVELEQLGILTFPVEVEPLGKTHCKIVDPRVPPEWFTESCTLCGYKDAQ